MTCRTLSLNDLEFVSSRKTFSSEPYTLNQAKRLSMAPKTNISWMTPSETLLRLGLGGFGDVKWAWGGGWCLLVFFSEFRLLLDPVSTFSFCSILMAPFSRPKNSSKTCAPQGASPVLHKSARLLSAPTTDIADSPQSSSNH